MVTQKIHSARDLGELNHYSRFTPETRRKIETAIAYMKDVVERYDGILPNSMLKGTLKTQVDMVRALIKADLEKHAKDAEKTAEFEKKEGEKLYVIGSGLLIASGLFFMATGFNPAVALAGALLSGIFYLEGFLCTGRALAKKEEAQLLREYDISVE